VGSAQSSIAGSAAFLGLVGRMKKELLLLSVSVSLCLFTLEVFARLYYFTPMALLPWYGGSIGFLKRSGFIRSSDDCEIVYDLKPNLDSYFSLTRLRTNSQGLRDREYSIPKPENTYRVAVLGDSVTMAFGVDIEDAYHSVLEEAYNAESDQEKYEFINFGVGGYSLVQYLATLKGKSLAYDPDHVVVGLCMENDVPVTNLRYRYCDYVPKLRNSNPYFEWWLLHLLEDKLGGRKHRLIGSKERKTKRDFALLLLDAVVAEFKGISERNNIGLTFVALRWGLDHKQEDFQAFRRVFFRHEISFIDTAPVFHEANGEGYSFQESGSKYTVYRADGHPNAEAHRLFAGAIKRSMTLE
jgi:lysophospholipase L1-like esterase